MRRIRYFAAVLALALTGCSAGAAAAPSPTATEFPMFTDGLLTYERVEQPGGGYVSMLALFTGTLTFENGCLLVGGDPFLFPADLTTWDGTTLTVGDLEYKVGDKMAAGGGVLHDTVLSQDIRDRCGDHSPVLVGGVQEEIPEPLLPPDLPTDEAWGELPKSPLTARRDSVGAWVDDRFVIVGGWSDRPCPPLADCDYGESAQQDGASYNPYTDMWQRIASAPVPVSQFSSVVLGGDLYLLTYGVADGGLKIGTNGQPLLTFLRYNSAADVWSTLPTPPSHGPLVAAGDRLLVIPGSDENVAGVDAVFDPADQTWTALPDDPLGPSFDRGAVWLGDSLLLTGKDLVESAGSEGPSLLRLATLDSSLTTWSTLPNAEIIGYYPLAVAERVVFPFYGTADGGAEGAWEHQFAYGGIFNPADQSWSALPELPAGSSVDDYADGALVVTVGDRVVLGGRLLLDPVAGELTALPEPGWTGRSEATVIAGPDSILVWGGAIYDSTAGTNHADGYLLGL